MEEIDKRLYSNNPINISNLISTIIHNIRKKHETGIRDFPEIKFLKEKLLSADGLISEVSGVALLQLIKDGILSIDSILTDVVSTMNTVKCHSTLTNILGDLLCLQLKNKQSPFNLHSPQHPFITLLIENSDTSSHTFNKVFNLQEEYDGFLINKIFEPFYLYCLCGTLKNNMDLLKHQLWFSLLNSKELDVDFCIHILCWLQVQRREELQFLGDQLSGALRCTNINTDLLILWQVNILYNLAINKFDMQSVLTCLEKNINKKRLVVTDSLLFIFSQIIDVCSPLHLKNLIRLCNSIIQSNNASMYSLETVRASLLQWLTSPCILIHEAYEIAKDTITYIDKNYNNTSAYSNHDLEGFADTYKSQISTNKTIFLSVHLALNLETFSNEEYLKKWLEQLQNVPVEFVMDIFNFLCGLMMVNNLNPEISILILDLLLKCIEKNISLSSKLLTLILYKISNNEHPQYNITLLKSLPKLVISRDNIPKVIAMIKAVSKGSENLFNLGLSLAYDAWKIDHKCYIYLEDLLVQNTCCKKKWERCVIKAYILKGLCEKKPELYGKDITAHLSKILNDCDNDTDALPCSIAIEAITVLCRVEVIDIKTTWATLAPKFQNDTRVPVVKSMCALIKEIPQLSYTEPYKDLFEAVTKQLWHYVDIGDSQISEVALLSLTSFDMEHIRQNLPEKYLEPGTVSNMQSLPGKTWIHFLIENSASVAATNFIKKMLSMEIDGFLKYVYQMKGPKEPINYNYLPSCSIVRAIGEFIKTWANKWRGSIHDKLYIECLKIYSVEYNKPLPPLDWCFLQELIHDPKTKEYCVDIASHQVVLSGTARRLIENYLVAATDNPQDEDILYIFKNLKFLTRSIQPVIIRPFFETSIWHAIRKYNQGEHELLVKMSRFLKMVLQQENVQETNKVTIVQVLDSIIFVTDIETKLFEVLCDTIITAPSKCLEAAVNFKVVDTEESFLKTVKIRCALAKSAKMAPLNWLNDIIDVWSTTFRNILLWPDLAAVCKYQSNNTDECVPWILELMGQMQAKIADRCEVLTVSFLFDILIFAVVHFSGFYTFTTVENNDLTKMKDLFPPSLAALLDRHSWEACSVQVLEWLYHMNIEETVSKEYRKIFGVCLQALKHNDEFTKNQRYMKYLSSRTSFN